MAGRPKKNLPKKARKVVEAQAARHKRTRTAHRQERAEDYVEVIADLIQELGGARTVDIAQRLGVTHVTVTKTISRFIESGLVKTEPYRAIFLTKKGKLLANKCKLRHEAVASFLKSLGISDEIAQVDAEGIEHHVSEETLQAFINYTAQRRPN